MWNNLSQRVGAERSAENRDALSIKDSADRAEQRRSAHVSDVWHLQPVAKFFKLSFNTMLTFSFLFFLSFFLRK